MNAQVGLNTYTRRVRNQSYGGHSQRGVSTEQRNHGETMNAHNARAAAPGCLNIVIQKACAHCSDADAKENGLRRCGGCKEVWYCSTECQKAAWPAHKAECTDSSKKQRSHARALKITAADRPQEPEYLEDISHLEWKGPKLIDWFAGDEEVDPDEVVYPYENVVLSKTRECYCYTMGGGKQKPATLVVKASDAKAVTRGDLVTALRGPGGRAFFECNHAFLEDIVWKKPGHYEAHFGS